MKTAIFAGPPTSGKTTVLKKTVRRLLLSRWKPAYLKVDVLYSDEERIFADLFSIPSRKIHSGDLCPDHCSVLILGQAIQWAADQGADMLLVETAGLCLRCAPYIRGGLGVVVLEATSGMNLPRKLGPMLTLADIAVITKIDLVSQAEREVFRDGVERAAKVEVIETDALRDINIARLVNRVENAPETIAPLSLKGNPPLGVCTICVGKKQIGWESHFGVVRSMDSDLFYRGE
ncbi:MAG: cobalamin biosynthesis protein [Nitrospinota bacterium]|nr:cobalamin biosynthesis protein [Nitrospinota bacterium]